METNILVIGDAAIDVYMTPHTSDIFEKKDDNDALVCFRYGDKIPVDHLEFTPGGNAPNVSIGLARLGIQTSMLTHIGSDKMSAIVLDHVKREGVDTTNTQIQSGTCNYSTIFSIKGERTVFAYHAKRTYGQFTYDGIPTFIYLTAMGEGYLPFYQQVIEKVKKNPGIQLVFNPGSIQVRTDPKELYDLFHVCSYIFLNKKEAEIFTGIKIPYTNKELLQECSRLCPNTIVITDGQQGAIAYSQKEYYSINALPVAVVEKTGAGDAFNVGFLGAICNGLTLEDQLLWATVNAASVIGYVGPQRGLLRKNDMQSWLQLGRQSNIQVQKI